MFLSLWTVMLLLPEDAQGMVLEDLMMVLTYLFTFVQDVVHEAEDHIFVTSLILIAIVGLAVFLCCARKRQNSFLDSIMSTNDGFAGMTKQREDAVSESPERSLAVSGSSSEPARL